MAYSYKGSISFGLVYIPVTLHSTIKNNDIGFNMIDKKTMSRVKYKKTCADCDGREVRQEDIVKGYEYEEGKYVLFDEKDFEKLKSKKDKNITIEQFVNLAEIDPLYFDKPYYVAPTGAEKAFSVLLSAMEEEGKAAVAKTVLGTKETLIAIRDAPEYAVFCGGSDEKPRERDQKRGERGGDQDGEDHHREHDGQVRARKI